MNDGFLKFRRQKTLKFGSAEFRNYVKQTSAGFLNYMADMIAEYQGSRGSDCRENIFGGKKMEAEKAGEKNAEEKTKEEKIKEGKTEEVKTEEVKIEEIKKEEDTIILAHIGANGQGQTLKAHLEGTAERAGEFAAEFGCRQAARLCGMLHDIGKNSLEFQARIRNPLPSNRVDHSTAGAKEAENISRDFIPLGMVIAGHHSGLMDGGNRKISTAGDGTYFGRKKSSIPDYRMEEGKKLLGSSWPVDGVCLPAFCKESRFAMSFFIRMLYSCLVDADFLDTEAFMKGMADAETGASGRECFHEQETTQRQNLRGGYASVSTLLGKFQDYVKNRFFKTTEKEQQDGKSVRPEGSSNAALFAARNEILQECMKKGKACGRGLYTLTVPTGGGKTIASTGFALQHAAEQKMKRIIYVIPYTSVIDQNGQVLEGILGEENVVEHHSGITDECKNAGEDGMDGQTAVRTYRKALAAENWDAPVIVTTAVQFFESLYGNRSSQCRKLHNLANSVIIFDEAQTLPVPYLKPCVAAMAQLVKNYGATIVLCTATQPALDQLFRIYFPQDRIPEICEDARNRFGIFKRTQIRNLGELTKEGLAEQLRGKVQALCIVNRRKLAQELYESLAEERRSEETGTWSKEALKLSGEPAVLSEARTLSGEKAAEEGEAAACADGCYCLTTLLYPADRKAKFAEIKSRLAEGKPCLVIATSLVEAGVDLDFPEVYRQEAGLDSLIQSAGRCNREGRRPAKESPVYSFYLTGEENRFQAQSIAALRETWRGYSEVDAPEAISHYFRLFRSLLGDENLDQKGILDNFERGIDGSCFPFAKVKEKFRLIEREMKTVLIPADGTEELLEQVCSGLADRNTFRKLGQYGVNVYNDHFKQLWEAGCLEEIGSEIFVLRDQRQYRGDLGLRMDVETGNGIFV